MEEFKRRSGCTVAKINNTWVVTADEGAISFFLVLHEKSGSSMPFICYLKNDRDNRLLRLFSVQMWNETKSKAGREQREFANGHPSLVQ